MNESKSIRLEVTDEFYLSPIVRADKAAYSANLTVTHLQQSLRICRPYMTPNEYIRFESDFAQMRKRDDYPRLSDSLGAVARKNNQTLPKFEPW